jgi:hypothetical protein
VKSHGASLQCTPHRHQAATPEAGPSSQRLASAGIESVHKSGEQLQEGLPRQNGVVLGLTQQAAPTWAQPGLSAWSVPACCAAAAPGHMAACAQCVAQICVACIACHARCVARVASVRWCQDMRRCGSHCMACSRLASMVQCTSNQVLCTAMPTQASRRVYTSAYIHRWCVDWPGSR